LKSAIFQYDLWWKFVPMFNRMILTAGALAISIAASAAKDAAKKEECPTLNHQEIENLLRRAPSCQRAIALFEICQFGSSGDVSFGALVTKKFERDFLRKLNAAQRRAYEREQKRCQLKYANEDSSMYRSFAAFCGADVARNYSAKFLKAIPAGSIEHGSH
jgi:hypothetical protein